MNNDFIRIDDWIPSKKDIKISYDGKLIVIPFDKIFNRQNNDALNNFIIKKESYVKKLDHITRYVNYFIKFYDTDNSLLMSYLKLKFLIDKKDVDISLPVFIKFVYNILITDNLIEKITKLVEDNYYIDLSSDDSGKKYNETLEFTQDHAKVMMAISMAMKIMVPVMFHYLNSYGLIKERKYIFRFYEGLFDIFGNDIDIYNKLWISIYSKVNVNYVRNSVIWEQREIFGTNTLTYMTELLRDKIISENFFKYEFNKNIVSFNYVVLDKQLRYFLVEPYALNRIELSGHKDSATGLSDLDKIEMNASKIDEGIVILSEINIKKTIKRIKKKLHVEISKEEIEYYKDNLQITKFQSQLVFYYYAKYFGYRNLNLLNRVQYLKLLIILKKRLQFQSCVYLPQIISSNITSKLNARTIRNNKFLSKIQTSDIYQHITEEKYSTLRDIGKEDLIINLLSTLLNTTFTFVDYDNKDLLGKPIEINQDVISDEFLNFLNQL